VAAAAPSGAEKFTSRAASTSGTRKFTSSVLDSYSFFVILITFPVSDAHVFFPTEM